MMKTKHAAVALASLLLAGPTAADGDKDKDKDKEKVRASLSGYQEVPTLASAGTASFKARIADDNQSFDWVLTFSGLTNVLQAHIHFGAPAINGGIVVFLCTNLANAPLPPAQPTQPCPTSAGTVSGTARPGDVLAVAAQGVAAGDFARVLDAIRAGVAYANIHTTQRMGGEIRGQIHSHDDD
jgi:hypothetical protein